MFLIILVTKEKYSLHEYYGNSVMQTVIAGINELITCSQDFSMGCSYLQPNRRKI